MSLGLRLCDEEPNEKDLGRVLPSLPLYVGTESGEGVRGVGVAAEARREYGRDGVEKPSAAGDEGWLCMAGVLQL
jgi:hypothetical protein